MSQQQPAKQFQIRKNATFKVSPITQNPSQRKTNILPGPIQQFQESHDKDMFNRKNILKESQFLAQIQGFQDSNLFGLKNTESVLYINLQNRCKQLEEKVVLLKQVIAEQETTISELKTQKEELQNQVEYLEEKKERQRMKKSILKDKIEQLQQELDELKQSVNQNEYQAEGDEEEEENEHSHQQNIGLSHNQLYHLLEYLQSRSQQQQWLQQNLQNYQQQDIDPDEMTYEQLLALEEQIGVVSKGLTKEQIKAIPKTVVQNPEEMPERCTICLVEYQKEDKFRELGCKHKYHSKCIKQWLQNEKICPLCKEEIKV